MMHALMLGLNMLAVARFVQRMHYNCSGLINITYSFSDRCMSMAIYPVTFLCGMLQASIQYRVSISIWQVVHTRPDS